AALRLEAALKKLSREQKVQLLKASARQRARRRAPSSASR
ncbi:MAG: hypothetical protein H6Q89_3758, partial [Myxococcaceae bacterium]|nr:hypothetical protein [Myxococcaceae bacterium]